MLWERPRMRNLLLLATLMLSLSADGCVAFLEEELKEEDSRIVDGVEAREGELPYQLSVQYFLGRSPGLGGAPTSRLSSHFCGGALVSLEEDAIWAVTAAHCMMAQQARNLQVITGALKLSDEENPAFMVDRIISHEYDDTDKKHDIALLKLKPNKAMKTRLMTHKAKPVDFCAEDFDATDLDCVVSGWGKEESGGKSIPDVLREARVTVVSQAGCKEMFQHIEGTHYPWDGDTMVCAGGADTDACQGDSGGPLVCPTADGSRCLYGIVSWGIGCATEGYPGAYTNVRAYKGWAEKQMEKN